MHAGVAKNGCNQRAYGGKFHAATVETTMPAGKRDEKCTPAWQRMAAASGHTEANSPPAQPKRPSWRGNRMKNARRRGNRIKNARRHGEERQRQWAKGDKFLAATVETTMPTENQNKKCTPAR
ncbi:hypothetical protein [Bianquea renquensis]|uniref:Uncharacterized protein n=1 Tax=Bianquea renquensis TaxID=2763661 RepID=A0A926I1Q9_9FIRM|nr:hypothetical protein [Bianquea renquensis]MBC8544519.1 hypothetical protein [Bianquea renquensis]